MNKRPVIIDCDPGIDDAMALLAAFRAPELDIKAITPVAGNVPLAYTAPNALKILALGGREDIPVYPGADRPLSGEVRDAADVHGADGLMGWPMPQPKSVLRDEKAWDVIWREAKALNGALELIATGPLTNLAIALAKYPDLPKYIKKLTVMGGGACFGNATPAAEFNIYADPEAAEMVFRSGMPIALCGLDVCYRASLLDGDIAALEAMGSVQAAFSAALSRLELSWALPGVTGAPMYDPCAMLYAIDPSIFTSVHCWVGVERSGVHTRGKTVTDAFSDAKRTPNVDLVLDVDRPEFARRLLNLLGEYGR